MTKSIGWLAAAVLCIAAPAQAADSTFLKSFAGSWVGKGTVKVDADSQPIKINCKFASDATESSLALNGKCTGYVVFSRAIGADVKTNGKTYTGIYTDRALALPASVAIAQATHWFSASIGQKKSTATVRPS